MLWKDSFCTPDTYVDIEIKNSSLFGMCGVLLV